MLGLALVIAAGFWWYGIRLARLEKRLEQIAREQHFR